MSHLERLSFPDSYVGGGISLSPPFCFLAVAVLCIMTCHSQTSTSHSSFNEVTHLPTHAKNGNYSLRSFEKALEMLKIDVILNLSSVNLKDACECDESSSFCGGLFDGF